MLPGDICIGELGPSQDTAAGGSMSARDRRQKSGSFANKPSVYN